MNDSPLQSSARRLLAAALTGTLLTTMIAVPAYAATPTEVGRPDVEGADRTATISGTVKGRARPADPVGAAAVTNAGPAAWPSAGKSSIAVTTATSAAGGQARTAQTAAQVEVLDRAAARAAKVTGVLLQVAGSPAQQQQLTVDYSSFAGAYGGSYGSRLTLSRLPDCALATPDKPECAPEPLKTTNDTEKQTLSAQVTLPATASTLTVAVAAADASAQGTYDATPLKTSSSWTMGLSSGQLSWSYPMRVPPVPGTLTPDVALSYSSQAMDGQTAATNNQGSWIGAGFTYEPGYIERRYKSCDDDGHENKGDLCWGTHNATMVLGGTSTELILDDTTGKWRSASDNNAKIEKTTGAANDDDNGETWKVTTTDGTQYFFGLNQLPGWTTGKDETNSVWTVPVFGDDDNEECHKDTYTGSWCQQAWRWNLDHVIDPHDNVMSYFYVKETNHYARNGDTDVNGTPYTRAGYLERIDYGQRAGAVYSSTAPARVVFGVAERCIPTSTFACGPADLTDDTATRWADVPWDRNCAASKKCADEQTSPSFWTRKRLTTVTTQILSGSSHTDVDEWKIDHLFTDNGDASRSLWPTTIVHTGKVGGTKALPAVDLTAVQRVNRVDVIGDGIAGLARPRLATVTSETGATMSIIYSQQQCDAANLPAPGKSTKRCFPVKWNPPGAEEPITDWFNKFVVEQVTDGDLTAGSPDMVTSYEYLEDAAWNHTDADGITESKYLTWGDWRGYGKVRVRKGDGQTMTTRTDYTFLRGMHGDKDPDGGTRDASVTDSTGATFTDYDEYSGKQLESILYNGTAVVSKTVTEPWRYRTATRARSWGTDHAAYSGSDVTRTYIALAAGGWRTTKTVTTFDTDTDADAGTQYGRVIRIDDFGDTTVGGDNRCTRTTYADSTNRWMLAYPARVETVAVNCSATPNRATQVLSDQISLYDGTTTTGAAPVTGDVTTAKVLANHDGTTATYVTTQRGEFDKYGRGERLIDAKGFATTTAHTETSGLTTAITNINTLGHKAQTVLNPAWGTVTASVDTNDKRTDVVLDPLGRVAQVYLPDRRLAAGIPNHRYTYLVSKSAPTAVKSELINNDATYTISYRIFDGQLRPRQTQAEGAGGGRLITDTFYNGTGKVKESWAAYHATGAPSATLVNSVPTSVNGQNFYTYDGADRQVIEVFAVGDTAKWRTTTSYGGDRVSVDPPDGTAATTTISDARGNTTELWRYRGPSATGTHDVTEYSYDTAGRLTGMTEPGTRTWKYLYDQRGRKTSATDPDAGTSTYTYDDLGRMLTSTDGRGTTLTHKYDDLGRKTDLYQGSTQLSQWVYDTAYTGQLYYSRRFVSATNYYTTVYPTRDTFYRPTTTRYGIAGESSALSKTYAFTTSYNNDGSVAGYSLPAAGGLAAENIAVTYDALRQPIAITGNTPYSTGYLYSTTGKLRQLEAGTGTVKTWNTFEYEAGTNRLKRNYLLRSTNASYVTDVAYDYDDAGNVVSMLDTPASATPDQQCFTYDHLARLTDAYTTTATGDDPCATAASAESTGGPAPYWHSYTYDDSSNRDTETIHPTGVGTAKTLRTYSYATGGNRLNNVNTVVGTTTSDATYTYDDGGNTKTKPTATGAGSQTLTWDTENRLASSTENGTTTTYAYDADGNRLLRREAGSITLYLPNLELKLTTSTGAVTGTRYIDLGGGLTAVRTNNGVTFTAADHHGTGGTAVDAVTGAVTKRRHTPFGTSRDISSIAWVSDRGFLNGTTDPTGMTHLGAREYDSTTGRFISVDPLLDLTDPSQWNGYAYAHNNPVTYSDPTGLLPPCGRADEPPCPDRTPDNDTETPGSEDDEPGGGSGGDSSGGGSSGSSGGGSSGSSGGGGGSGGGNDVNGVLKGAGEQAVEVLKTPLHIIEGMYECGKKYWHPMCLGPGAVILNASADPAGAVAGMWEGTVGPIRDDWNSGQKDEAVGRGFIMVLEAVVGGKGAGTLSKLGRNVAAGAGKTCKACGVVAEKCNSFAVGTMVLMADGTAKAIDEVVVGDEVVATDPITGETRAKEVTAEIVGNGVKHLVKLSIKSESGDEAEVTATDSHPFWVPATGEWVDATDLRPGEWLRTNVGTRVQIDRVERWTEPHTTVHNLTVTDLHTYYVLAGNIPVLVHNAGGDKLRPDYNAEGPHTTFLRDRGTGQIKKWATWIPQTNPRNPAPWEMVERFDLQGPTHTNRDGTKVPTPHINLPNGGDARPAQPWEIPGSGVARPSC
ncbi:polymorphic toxin-type HINT domain-containing protein [Actinoplanes derwentensis]|uniref:RHS repeat-associated core domain-containing protein n=1 Tax=Actinoplanes derwentensis TaxID=113562 RepID=A0A1H2DD89_9ACTN|nr:polymorphic toxin-type HINT domain-containing protein [Actinoplanes derwentensis]GID89649.1 hypothetical protein Ade03nite_85730 [Actinoplanes derwentensis]SDT80703.1 RHS repeat-associated core domain-containing protein [Actinoplanes derwentensis]